LGATAAMTRATTHTTYLNLSKLFPNIYKNNLWNFKSCYSKLQVTFIYILCRVARFSLKKRKITRFSLKKRKITRFSLKKEDFCRQN
jgi:hypothetical protein